MTPEIEIRDWQGGDLLWFRFWLQKEHRWHRLDAPYQPPMSDEEADELVEEIANWLVTPPLPFASRMVISLSDGEPIGTVCRYRWESDRTTTYVGIALYDPELWGQGIGRKALVAWIELLKAGYLELNRICLSTWTGNTAMVRVARHLGFKEFTRVTEAYECGGFKYDRVSLELTIR